MNEKIEDVATATAALNKVGRSLADAVDCAAESAAALRELIVRIRPMGVLTVGEMAEAVGRERNYIDSIWSGYGETSKGKQTRVGIASSSDAARENAVNLLAEAASDHRRRSSVMGVLRAERDLVVVMVYASKILGPSAIAAEVGVDRNHVLRLARKAGVTPQHRSEGSVRNQYTKKHRPAKKGA